jgi:hypothetical protein
MRVGGGTQAGEGMWVGEGTWAGEGMWTGERMQAGERTWVGDSEGMWAVRAGVLPWGLPAIPLLHTLKHLWQQSGHQALCVYQIVCLLHMSLTGCRVID